MEATSIAGDVQNRATTSSADGAGAGSALLGADNAWNESAARNGKNQMDRRGEDKLLDERIRERYQREIGDIFDD